MPATELHKYTVKEVLNAVLNTDGDALNIDALGAMVTLDGDVNVDVSAFVNSEGEQVDAIVYTDGQSIATGYSPELILAVADRDFSAASGWTNVDINAYDETGDLTITASAVGQYCTLAVANAPTTPGTVYRLSLDAANVVGSWEIQDFNGIQTIGIIDRSETGQFIDFVAQYRAELIRDSDNTDFADGTINEWAVSTDGDGTCAYNVGPDNEKCAKLTVGATPGTYTYGLLATSEIVPLVNGETYTAKAKVYIPSANNNWTLVKIGIMNLASAVVVDQTRATLTVEDAWQEVSVEFKMAADVTGSIGIGGETTTTGDIVYFDDITITRNDAVAYTGGFRIVAVDATSSADFDNFSLKAIFRHFQGMGGYDATGNTFRALPVNIDDTAAPASPNFIPVGGEYRLSMTTYADGDATIWQATEQGKIITGSEQVHDAGVTGWASMIGAEYKLIDGAALPNVVSTEADITRLAASIGGALFSVLITQDGLGTPLAVHDDAIASGLGTAAVMGGAESKTFDGSALPNVVNAEADMVRLAASLYGVQYSMLTTQSGADSPIAVHDTAVTAAAGGSAMIMAGGRAQAFDGVALPYVVGTEGDAVRIALSLTGVQYAMLTGEDGSSTPIIDQDVAIGSGLGVAMVIQGYESKDFDGGVLPNVVGTEGDAVRGAASLYGVQYVKLVNETGALGLDNIEDEAHASGDLGIMALAIRNDLLAVLTSTDGDYAGLQVNDIGALYVTGEHREDDAHVTLDYGHQVLGVRNDVLASLCDTDGDYTPPQMNDIGAMFVTGEHREDDAHVTLDYGMAVWTVRNDILAQLTDADGDYAPFQTDALGALYGTMAAQADLETTHHNAASVTANGTVADVDGYTMALIHSIENTSGWDRTGTYTIQASPDGGTTYKNVDIWDVENGRALAGAAITIASGENRSYLVDLRGMDKLRVDLSVTVAGTTGTITITSRAIPISDSVLHAMAQGADGSAVPPGMLLVGGSDGTNLEALQVVIDNAGAGATPNTLIVGGTYKATVDTYADNDAAPLLMTDKGILGVEITSGQNLTPIFDTNAHAGFIQITDGSSEVDVETMTATTDNLDGKEALVTASLLYGRATNDSATPITMSSMAAVTDNLDGNNALNVAAGLYGRVDANNLLPVGLIATILSLKSDLSSVAGTVTNVNGGNRDAGTQTVTLADNDPAVTSLAVIDDWDETDRAKVNPIAGQAGIAANAGAMDALTTRVTIATDDTHYGAVGAAADVDGVVHGQLRFIGESVDGLETDLATVAGAVYADDADWTDTSSSHMLVGGLYQSTPQTITDGDVGPIQLDSNGRVLVGQVIPGTGATDLGKAIDSAVGATDTGIGLLARHASDTTHLTTAEGDYDVLRLSDYGALHVAPEQHHIFDALDATTGWTALSNDTLNLATTKKHVLGTDALTFDKVDGAANTVFAAIQKTLTSVDLGNVSPHDLIQTACYLPTLTDVDYVFVRLGTDSSNYNEWRIEDDALTAAIYQTLIFNVGDADYTGITGNGWNPTAITYICIGVAFDAETDALAGIVFDEVSFHTNQHTSAELTAEVSSSISSANVNLQKIGGSATDKNAGNASNGSQRVVVATDDVNLAAIKTAAELIDHLTAADAGAVDANTQRVVLASDDPAVAHLGNMFYGTGADVTPSDVADIAGAPYYALFIGTSGNVKIDLNTGGTITLNNVADGTLLPFVVDRVYATGTTATNIVAFKP